jgi:hypothetical protein
VTGSLPCYLWAVCARFNFFVCLGDVLTSNKEHTESVENSFDMTGPSIALRLHEYLTEDEATYEDLLRQATEDRQLFVVPAFEASYANKKRLYIPNTMEELREMWEKKDIDCFHCHNSPTGHMPTDFKKLFDNTTTKAYPVPYRYCSTEYLYYQAVAKVTGFDNDGLQKRKSLIFNMDAHFNCRDGYEPYVIGALDQVPLYDARFRYFPVTLYIVG